MKIDRLLGITTYLMNRSNVTAGELSERFEVSTRTIQRDMDTLAMAGIPVVSYQGSKGGYSIIDGFKLEKDILSPEEYGFIKNALEGLCTAYGHRKLEDTVEKITGSDKFKNTSEGNLKLDLSAAREGKNTDEYLQVIGETIRKKKCIQFHYRNSYGSMSTRKVEPIGAVYKWYAWYLLGYCKEKKDYRFFKVARIKDLVQLDETFSNEHETFHVLLRRYEEEDNNTYMSVKISFKEKIKEKIEEYFPKAKIYCDGENNAIMEFTAPENERGWKGLLYTFGGDICILEPNKLKEEFVDNAKGIIENNFMK